MVSGEKIWTMEEMQIRRVLPWNIPETPEGGATRWALSELIASLYGLWPLYIYILVGGIPTPLKNMTLSVGMMKFPIYRKIKAMFQTTNQYSIHRLYKPNYNILGALKNWANIALKKIHPIRLRGECRPDRSVRFGAVELRLATSLPSGLSMVKSSLSAARWDPQVQA